MKSQLKNNHSQLGVEVSRQFVVLAAIIAMALPQVVDAQRIVPRFNPLKHPIISAGVAAGVAWEINHSINIYMQMHGTAEADKARNRLLKLRPLPGAKTFICDRVKSACLKQPTLSPIGEALLLELNISRMVNPDQPEPQNTLPGLTNPATAPASVEDLIGESTPGDPTRGYTENWEKSGGKGQADKDFDRLQPSSVKPITVGGKPARTGVLPDGRKVVVRPVSSGGQPTLEIQDGKKRTKIRYNPS